MNNIMKYKGYNGTVEYSFEDDVLFGKVIGIKSLISYEGENFVKLKENFENSIDEYLKMCEVGM